MTQQSHFSADIWKRWKIIRNLRPYVHSSIVYNSQDMEATQVSINKQMDKDMVNKHNGILTSYLKKDKIMPFATTWMQLEIIILREISQKKTYAI